MHIANQKTTPIARTPSVALTEAAEQWLYDLSSDQRQLIQLTWRTLLTASKDFGAEFYARFFALDPSAAQLFHGDPEAQQQRLVETLDQAMQLVDRPDQLVLLLRAAGSRHSHYRVRHAHFLSLHRALREVVNSSLRDPATQAGRPLLLEWFRHAATIMRRAMARPA